jgi:hypothetical protein
MKALVAAVALAAVAAALLAVAPARTEEGTRRCSWGEVKARIGGRTQCLRDGIACSAHRATAYRRAGFACRAGLLEFDWRILRKRPVVVPQLASGAACPLAPRTRGLPGYPTQPAWGPGPAWPFIGGVYDAPRLDLEFTAGPPYDEWGVRKVMWSIDPRYHGAVLVRGRQLDGPNELRFESGEPGFTEEGRLNPQTELRLVGGYVHPAVTRVREPGCYAWQVDGIGFSHRIVFEAVRK